jgi:hypothetical protein
MTTSSNGKPANGKSFFDLHITGLGYLNRVREVRPRKGDPFLACDIAALCGPSDNVEYCRFDVKVSGADAQHLIRRCEQAVKAERKVLIGFRLGDLWVDQFTYSKGDKAGQPGVSLKARLLFISWIKVDKQLVYKSEVKAPVQSAHEEPPASEPATNDTETSSTAQLAVDASALTASAAAVASMALAASSESVPSF